MLSGDDDKWSQNHVMTCEKDLYKTQNPCIRNTKTELSHMGTELGLGWLAQLGLGKPTRVRRRLGGVLHSLQDAPELLADLKKKRIVSHRMSLESETEAVSA